MENRNIWRVTVPFVNDMGSISPFNATASLSESKEANALWTINSMRDHDGLPHLRQLPQGTRFALVAGVLPAKGGNS